MCIRADTGVCPYVVVAFSVVGGQTRGSAPTWLLRFRLLAGRHGGLPLREAFPTTGTGSVGA